MKDTIQFALLGIGLGSIYALLGQGIVLIYRGSGVLNLAHGGFATIGAFVFVRLHSPDSFATSAGVAAHGWPVLPAIAAATALTVVLGVLTDQLLLRRMRHASPLARLIATLALLLVIEAAAAKIWGVQPPFVPPVLPSQVWHLGSGIVINASYVWLLGITVALTAVLTMLWRFTRIGWVTAAVSHNQRGAAALGISPELVSTATWGFGAGLAGLAGILITPITQVSIDKLSLTVIAALAAVLLGGFESFPATLLSGLLVGMSQSIISNHELFFEQHLKLVQTSDALPLLVIVAVLLVRGSSLPLRGHVSERLPAIGSGRVRYEVVLPALAIGLALIFTVFSQNTLFALMVTFMVSIILLSLVVLTGYAGQLSLAQYAVAGIGGLIAARLAADASFPFLVAAVVGVIGAVLAGVVVAIPALRTRGVNLAVVTLAFGWAMADMVFNNPHLSGETSGISVGQPSIFGWSIDTLEHPARYAALTFVLFVGCALLVANLRRGRLGRRMIAVRSNERAAAAVGIGVFATKLVAFAIAGALAGLGGVLLAFQYQNAIFTGFDPFTSLLAVAQIVIGGLGFVFGTVTGAIVAPGALLSLIGLHWQGFTSWLPLVGGIGALMAVLFNQNGIASENVHGVHRLEARLPRRRARRPARPPAEPAVDVPSEVVAVEPVAPKRLAIENVTVRYGGVIAVDGVSIDVRPGEVVGLIGPNGAGKTSLMDAVSGFTPYSGRVLLEGKPIDAWPPQRRAAAGLVRSFQGLELFGEMSVLENLQVPQDRHGGWGLATEMVRPARATLPPLTLAAVREFGLAPLLQRSPGEISYGHRRLVAIARAVAAQPSVLLLDEPVSGLDDRESAEFAYLVRRLADAWGMAVLVIEHDMSFVMSISDRVVVIDFGRHVCEGTAAEVRNDPSAIAAYLGEDVLEIGADKAVPGTASG
jgi:ABC-type branched-subunit amino acid transport system ATPase component/branched-subunit amino acid ABC-type transport system permease component